jgi:hypothetical protein
LPHTFFHGEYVSCGAAGAEFETPNPAHRIAMAVDTVTMQRIIGSCFDFMAAEMITETNNFPGDIIEFRAFFA